VAAQNLRMIREIATLYGGRPSTLSTFKLARMVISHLAVAGGLALSDSLIQHVIGKGLIGRLSARFGEGAVNGILTARIGLAARDVCRPIPQDPAAKETLAALIREIASLGPQSQADETAGG
jgi:putative membrane protein